MKAVLAEKYGSAEILQMKDVQIPEPRPDELRIRVKAVALNPLDWHFMRGEPFLVRIVSPFKPKYKILGADVAGVVDKVGSTIEHFKPGDKVFGDLFGSGLGGLAEFVCTTERSVVKMPVNSSFEEASAIPVAGLTALFSLRNFGKLQSGNEVLVNGASGGVGTYTVQLAKTMGASVTGVCSTRNLDLVKSLGASDVIDYTQTRITDHQKQYDVIIDNVGNLSLSDFRRMMKPRGLSAVVGFTGMSQVFSIFLFGGKRIRLVTIKGTKEDLNLLSSFHEENKIKSVIDKTYPLEKADDAMAYLEEGHARGKVIVQINSD